MKKLELASARTCGPRESIVKQAFRGACPQIFLNSKWGGEMFIERTASLKTNFVPTLCRGNVGVWQLPEELQTQSLGAQEDSP